MSVDSEREQAELQDIKDKIEKGRVLSVANISWIKNKESLVES